VSPAPVTEVAPDVATGNGHAPVDEFDHHAQARKAPKGTTDEDGKALKALDAANKMAGLKPPTPKRAGTRIRDAIERGEGDKAKIDLHFENAARASVTVKQLFDPRHMDGVLTQATKVAPDYHTPKEWRPFAIAVLQAAKPDRTTGGEDEETLEWLSAFVASCDGRLGDYLAANEGDEVDEAYRSGKRADGLHVITLPASDVLYEAMVLDTGAFLGSDGRLYVRVTKLYAWMADNKLPRVLTPELRARLGRLGFTKPNNDEGKLTCWNADRSHSVTRPYLASEPDFTLSPDPKGW
jgi:hypothetical protein